jgi:hypothetical protein
MPTQNELFTAQAIKNTAPVFLKGVTQLTMRERFLLSYLQKAGRFLFNQSGPTHTWNVKIRQPEIYTTRGEAPQFIASDVNEQLTISHAAYRGVDQLDHFTQMVNKGSSQIVDLFKDKMTDLTQSMIDRMNAQAYGSSASDNSVLSGLNTIFVPKVGSNDDRCAVPADGSTYAGKSMVLGDQGGAWSAKMGVNRPNTYITTDWPDGNGDAQHDYLAPTMFNYTGNWSGTATNNWKVNCEMILRRAKVAINARTGAGAAPTLHLMTPEMYNQFQESVSTRERLTISDYSKSLGFGDMLNFEGALLAYDVDCPAGTGYGINPTQVALYSLHDQLFFTDGPSWETLKQAWVMLIGFVGNFRWNPKYFAQYGSYAA